MPIIHHINAGWLHAPPNPRACCHCLLIEDPDGLALIDTGIGLRDIADPDGRVGREAIGAAGFQFVEADTAVRRIEALGFDPADVRHIILTHADPDHAGGLADFPHAEVHLAAEELANLAAGNPRYRAPQFEHGPKWRPLEPSGRRWYGLEARAVDLGFEAGVLLIPLLGHTLGHCGVAVTLEPLRWTLHVGDAYYLRLELETDDHPVSQLAALRADSDPLRRASLEELRRLHRHNRDEVEIFGYHDESELPV